MQYEDSSIERKKFMKLIIMAFVTLCVMTGCSLFTNKPILPPKEVVVPSKEVVLPEKEIPVEKVDEQAPTS